MFKKHKMLNFTLVDLKKDMCIHDATWNVNDPFYVSEKTLFYGSLGSTPVTPRQGDALAPWVLERSVSGC